MPVISVQAAGEEDLRSLVELDHRYSSSYVWQMEVEHNRDAGRVTTIFHQVRLPREVRVEYPRPPSALLLSDLERNPVLLARLVRGAYENDLTRQIGGPEGGPETFPVGYAALALDRTPGAVWITDLVVDRPARRCGIAISLMESVAEWTAHLDCSKLLVEMQPKNYPAIQLVLKLGFEFCGYNDTHFANQETAIFFKKNI